MLVRYFLSSRRSKTKTMRRLKQEERNIVEALLHCNVSGADILRSQLQDCFVYPMNVDETILRFQIPPHAPAATLPYTQNVAVEANANDLDQGRVEVLLHVKEGRLYELEYVKENGTHLKRIPEAADLHDFIVHW